MKFSTIATMLPVLASAARYSKEEYQSGMVHMMHMEAKEVCHLDLHYLRVECS
jgi:hypothetical protein